MEKMEKKILKHLIATYVNKKYRNDNRKRQFLINCIDNHGYIETGYTPLSLDDLNLENEDGDAEEYDELYQHFMPNSNNNTYNSSIVNPEFQQSIQEQSQVSVDPYGFNRTFIGVNYTGGGGGGNYIANKLSELQKRGITYEETQFTKVKETMESIILEYLQNKMNNQIEIEKILQTALNIYLNILIYYKQNPFGFSEIKASLKNGYIFLCIFYSFIYNNIYVTIPSLMDHAGKIRLRDLPIAERNMKMIFNGIKGYSFMERSVTINPKNVFNKTVNIDHKQFLHDISKILQETQEFIPNTSLGVYSVVYFICNYYYSFKVKLEYNETLTLVTYDLLNAIYEPFSSATVRKLTDQLRTFYKR